MKKEIVKYTVAIKVGGKWRTSEPYDTAEEACKNIVPFLTICKQRYTSVTITRNVSTITEEAAQ